MLEVADYKKINAFKDAVEKNLFLDDGTASFRHMTSKLLNQLFDYRHTIFGYLNQTKTRVLSQSIATYNLNLRFVQSFMGSQLMHDRKFVDSGDIAVFSRLPNYKKSVLYRDQLDRNGLADFALVYLPYNDTYAGFLIVFKERAQGRFDMHDTELFEAIRSFLGSAYYHYGVYILMRMTNDLIMEQTAHYPVGIVVTDCLEKVYYVNNVGKTYLNEMGVTNTDYFPVFFTDHILPHLKFDMVSTHKENIVRYKNFLFSYVSAGSADELIESLKYVGRDPTEIQLPRIPKRRIGVIYISKDKMSSYNQDVDYYRSYSFSEKEEMVVDMVLSGKSNWQIAEEMGISINTVRVHLQHIYRKTNVTSRADLILKLKSCSGFPSGS